MRWSLRAGVAVAVASLLVGGLVSPANAVVETTAPAAEASTTEVAVASAPYLRNLSASYDLSATPFSVSATTFTITLPPELADFDLTELSSRIRGSHAPMSATVTVDPSTNSVTIPIKEGFFTSPDTPPTPDGFYNLSLTLAASASMATESYPPSLYEGETGSYGLYSGISISVKLAPAPAAEPADYRVDLSAATPSDFAYRTMYWAAPADASAPPALSETRTIDLTGMPFGPDATGTVLSTTDAATTAEAELSQPAEGTTRVALSDLNAEPFLTGNGRTVVRVQQTIGREQVSVATSATVVHSAVSRDILTTRISGADRYLGAIAYSQAQFPGGTRSDSFPDFSVPVVYAADGGAFADALSAAADAAVHHGALLLLPAGRPPYQAPMESVSEIGRLYPGDIVISGGEATVSREWSLLLADQASTNNQAERIRGADRYAVSRGLALSDAYPFPGAATTVFIATGTTFPDALAAVPAAASKQAPVLLVNGGADSLDAPTLDALKRLGAASVVIVGGPASVSPGIQSQLQSLRPGAVTRIGGADRYEVAAAVADRYFPDSSEVFLATGATYSDALTGGVLAASRDAPLLLSRPDCVPAATLDLIDSPSVTAATLLGGPASLGRPVLDLTRCR
ncbi:cell wall-binding repeat-containing protein [Herbiconiux sp. YIM B11900]|uniref:cell wall-binding repeat-containing protein n=1 Tax=Herbiconiux sp. YIM B11900 TaxID=3404131 RepID=UPI003F8556C2